MIKINEIKSLHEFFSYVLFNNFQDEQEHYKSNKERKKDEYFIPDSYLEKDLTLDFWREKLKDEYDLANRCICNSFDYQICSTIYLETKNKNDIFKYAGFIYNSNLGLFIMHTDKEGCISECEWYFKENKCPPFQKDLIKLFPDKEDSESDKTALDKIKSIGCWDIKNLTKMKREKMYHAKIYE